MSHSPEEREQLEREHRAWREMIRTGDIREIDPDFFKGFPAPDIEDHYFTNAFEHAAFPVMHSDDDVRRISAFRWGMVPRWCRDMPKALELRNQCINARGETMFEKPSFRASALDRRGIVLMTGFFEYHQQGSSKYPFFVQHHQDDILPVACLWDEVTIGSDVLRTFAVVTIEANHAMAKIHNNPKNPHRMPLILTPEQFDAWLKPISKDDALSRHMLQTEVMRACPSSMMRYTPVPPLVGKAGVGDHPLAQAEHQYIDLDPDFIAEIQSAQN